MFASSRHLANAFTPDTKAACPYAEAHVQKDISLGVCQSVRTPMTNDVP